MSDVKLLRKLSVEKVPNQALQQMPLDQIDGSYRVLGVWSVLVPLFITREGSRTQIVTRVVYYI
jgi:hypothetical protein